MFRFLIVLLVLLLGFNEGPAADILNRKVRDFTLKDYRGKPHSLADFKQNKLAVIVFLGTECPLAKLYAPRLAKLAEKYADRGVAFIGINANRQDSITEIAAHARIHGIKFPILKDLGNRVADQMGAVRTPEVYVLDEKRVVRYWGRIDDQYGVGYIRDEPKQHDLQAALDQLLAGKPVATPVTKSVGCHIGRIHKPDPNAEVTYANQIVRILQRRCVECHRTGQIAPFSLTKYEEVAGWAEMIAEVVRDQRMPPWHADPKHGRFANDRLLTAEEKQQIFQWVDSGAPQGDSKRLPPPRRFALKEWQLPRKPDRVFAMRDEPFRVPAEGTVRYQYFMVDPGFTEDKWVKMAEIVPGNRAVVHHVLVLVRPPRGTALQSRSREGYLAAYVPGMRAQPLPDGMAKRVPAGSKFVFQVHYTPIGSVQMDKSKLGLVFADPKQVKHAVVTTRAIQSRFLIPPRAENHRVEATSRKNSADVLLLSMFPHMHLRGKSFRYEARYPNGTSEILLDVPKYDFNWQTSYRLAQPKQLPAGTRIHCVAHYDNSENNLANPDPEVAVRWGDQTWNEMMIGYFDVAVPVDSIKVKTNAAEPAAAAKQSSAKIRAARLIKQYDKDKNGTVSRSEVPEKLQRLFQRIDANGDGVLTTAELLRSFGQASGGR